MASAFLELPCELRDRIYHFALDGARCAGTTDGNNVFVLAYSPSSERVPRPAACRTINHITWAWVFTSKQVFCEARAQFHRQAWLHVDAGAARDIFADVNAVPQRSNGPLAFLDVAHVPRYSISSTVRRSYTNTYFVSLSLRSKHVRSWGFTKTLAPSLRRFWMQLRPLPNIGMGVGTMHPACALIPESLVLPGMTFEHVELVLREFVFEYRKRGVAHLQGVMLMYAKMQEALEAAAITLIGLSDGEGLAIRDWTTGGAHEEWHIEVQRRGRPGVERCVTNVGLQCWADLCDSCADKRRECCKDGHLPARFTKMKPIDEEDLRFFCQSTKETVRRVNGTFEIARAVVGELDNEVSEKNP